jgi:hypothetical protein
MPALLKSSDYPEQDHPRPSWRDTFQVHAACEMFPPMSPDELCALGKDIKKNGLVSPIAITTRKVAKGWDYQLLDGRNRLDAMELVGISFKVALENGQCWLQIPGLGQQVYPALKVADGGAYADPYAYVLSANIHRRHLTTEQKRDLIAKVLKAQPEKSDRQIATAAKTDHKTVASVRAEQEARGEIPHVSTRTDTKGRQQPAKRKQRNQGNVEAELAAGRKRIIEEVLAEQESADQFGPRRAELPAATDVQLLQARISELEAALNQRDIRIAGLEKKVRHLLQVRKAAAADDELSDQCTAKHNAARNKGSKIQRSDAFESYINYLQKIGCDIEIRATRPKADQPADQDPAPTEAPTTTTLQ